MKLAKRLTILSLLAFSAGGLTACGGDDDDDESSQSGAVSSCRSMCAVQYQNCPDEVDFCNQLCGAIVPNLTAECQGTANTYYQCAAGVEWTCQSIIANQVDSSLCQSELEAYNACLM